MNPPENPKRRSTDHWSDDALNVKFESIDNILMPLLPLPVLVAKLESRMETLVTKDDLHEELAEIAEQMSANRRVVITAAVSIVVALITAAATVIAAAF